MKTYLEEYLQTYLWLTLSAIVLWLLKSRFCPHTVFEVTPVTSNTVVFGVTLIWGCWTTLSILGLTPRHDPSHRESYLRSKESYERMERQTQAERERLEEARVEYEAQIRLAEAFTVEAEVDETAGEVTAKVTRRKRAKRTKSDKSTAKYTTRFERIGK